VVSYADCMLPELSKLLAAIPEAAKSPYSLIAYAIAVAAWTAIAWRVQRHKILLTHIRALPPNDRLPAIRAEMGLPSLANDLTAEQYLRSRIHTFLFVGYLFTGAVVVIVLVVAYMDTGHLSGVLQ
jgi:hypothetical protein